MNYFTYSKEPSKKMKNTGMENFNLEEGMFFKSTFLDFIF